MAPMKLYYATVSTPVSDSSMCTRITINLIITQSRAVLMAMQNFGTDVDVSGLLNSLKAFESFKLPKAETILLLPSEENLSTAAEFPAKPAKVLP